MNMTMRSRRRHYITKVGLSLLILALIAGMMGCAAGSTGTVQYDLTIDSTEGGSVDVPGEGTFTCDAGRIIDLSAIVASGYRFVNWTGDVDTINNRNAASTTITMDGDYSITANFEQTAAPYYTLTMAVTGSGATSPDVGQHTRAAGADVYITASPASGYRFVNWTAPAGSFENANAAETTFTMPGQDVTVTAHFEEAMPYTLTMAVTGSGSTSPVVGEHTYTAGTAVTISASPASGYRFVNWTAAAGSFNNASSATTTFTMPAQDVTVTAHFEEGPPVPPDEHTLTMAVTGSGSTSPAVGEHTYIAGTAVPISASPASDYYFSHWTAAAGSFTNASSATTTFTMPDQDVTVTAHFELVPTYALTMAVTPPGSGSTSPAVGEHTYTAGTAVPISASPASGYYFSHWTAAAGSFTNASSATTTFTMPDQDVTVTAHFEWINFMVSAGDLHTVGLKSNGTVLAVGDNTHGQCNVGSWTDIVQVTASGFHTVGLKSDGTVVATGNNDYGQCNVGGWTDIVQVAAGGYHTVGLKYDGSVVAAGYNYYGQCNVGGWTGITQVAADGFNTVGLKSDGTVVATGNNWYGQRNVSGWTNIIQVAAGSYHTVGLRSNGTVIAVGDNARGQCNVGGWTNIIQIAAGGSHTVGLRANGTVVAVGDNYHGQCSVSGWTGIIKVTAGWQHTVGLKPDGTVVAVGWNEYGECNVGSWDLR